MGEWVMVKLVEERVGGALEPKNEGPYKVVAVDENRNCELEGMGKGLRKTYPRLVHVPRGTAKTGVHVESRN